MLESYSYDVIHKHSIQALLKEQADILNETEADQSQSGFRPPVASITLQQSSTCIVFAFNRNQIGNT